MPKFNKVLLVEDDPITILVCTRILKLTDFAKQVVPVQNGQEALDYLNNELTTQSDGIPEIIFLDINMPVMNAWGFLDAFANVEPKLTKIPSIFILSSTVDPGDEEKGLSYRYVKRFFSKPLTKEFLDTIEPGTPPV